MKKTKKGGILSKVGMRSLGIYGHAQPHGYGPPYTYGGLYTAVYLEAMDSCSGLVKPSFYMIVRIVPIAPVVSNYVQR